MNNHISKIIGLLLIVIGIGYLGDQMYLWNFTIFFDGWWAVLITLGALYSMIEDGFHIWNGFLAIFGIYFFLDANNLILFDITFMMVISIALIVLGIKLLFFKDKPLIDTNIKKEETILNENEKTISDAKKLYINTSFTTRNIKESGIIDRLRIENFFGHVILDIREADLRTMDAISIDSIFGTVEVIVGNDVNLKLYKNRMLSGSYIDSTITENGYDVFVRGCSIFGTIKINKAKPV